MQALLRLFWDGTPVEPARRVRTSARLGPEGLELRCSASLWGREVHADPPGPTPRLWESEVVEWFVAGEGGYTEIELGPFGNHLVLRFSGYRQQIDEQHAIEYRSRVVASAEGRRWYGDARVPLALLPPPPHRLNVCAIQPGPVYLQWRPGRGDKPDFHTLAAMTPVDLSS